MTDSPGAILTKLESLAANQSRFEQHLLRMDESHNNRLLVIEKTMGILAVQDEKFNTIKQEQKAQWRILDDNFKQGGTIDQIKLHQAHCPIDRIDKMELERAEYTKRLVDVELCQAACPAKSSNKQMAVVWSILVVVCGLITALFNMVIHQAESLANLVKNGAK